MPTYDYQCQGCQKMEEHIHSIKESPEILCSKCGSTMKKMISRNIAGFSIKGGSPSIHWREKRQRIAKSEKLKETQKQKYDNISVAPNIAGVRYDSWSDAQKVAKEAGLNTESYKPWVEKEKKKTKGIILKSI